MRFTHLVFGKEIDAISIDDLAKYFKDPKEESDKIEFKSFETSSQGKNDVPDRERKIMATVCGFLNSEGGLLIWGAPTNKTIDGKSVCFGDLTPTSIQYQKDQFIGKIADSIVPSPQGILFRALEQNGVFVYLLDVPKSEYAPHQFRDKYYMRMDGQTKAAPHHFIEALFKKITFPNLEAYLKLDKYEHVKLNNDGAILSCSIIFRNQSPFKNDFNLHYRVFSSHGQIISNFDVIHISRFDSKNTELPGDYANDKVADVIYYGNWIDSHFKILLSRNELHSRNYSLDIRIQFGAKHSPMKICVYHLVIGETMNPNLQDHITSMTENKFFNIHEESIESTDQERLLKTLGR